MGGLFQLFGEKGQRFPVIGSPPTIWSLMVDLGVVMAPTGVSFSLLMCCVCVSHSVLFDSATPWTVACQASLSMGFSKHEYWSGLPFPSPVYLPDTEIEPISLMSSVLAGGFFTTSTTC